MLGPEVGCMKITHLLSATGVGSRDLTQKPTAEEGSLHVRVNLTIPPPTPPFAGWLEGYMVRVYLPVGSRMVEMEAPPPRASLAATTGGTPPGLTPRAHLPQGAFDPSAAGDPWSSAV